MPDIPYRLHPLFVHFPIAFWVSAAALDLVQWSGLLPAIPGIEGFALPHLLLWAGVAAALPTVTAGLIDYARLPSMAQDSKVLQRHIVFMGAAFGVFLCAAIWRAKTGGLSQTPGAGVLLLEALGVIGLMVGGHLASRVVFEVLPEATQSQTSDQLPS